MSPPSEIRSIEKDELIRRLFEAPADTFTVITPNRRLAAALAGDVDARRIGEGLSCWESPDVLSFAAFVERLHGDALYSEFGSEVPMLLSPLQEQAQWESVIASTEAGGALLAVAPAASLAREAWQLAHGWNLADRLGSYPAGDDARAFADWAWRYEGATRRDRHTDRARLPAVVAGYLARPALRKPRELAIYGFDILPPQLGGFIGELENAGVEILQCAPRRLPSGASRVAFVSAREEIHAAARWARSRMERAPGARIGIVVPGLEQLRERVRRELTEAMDPSRLTDPAERGTLPFNISLGAPLADRPIVSAALLALEFAAGEIEFQEASRLLRSPFTAAAESERLARARLDAALRESTAPRVGLDALRRAMSRLSPSATIECPVLLRCLDHLERLRATRLAGNRAAREWAETISVLLDVLGFPGERSLDSEEFQTWKSWQELLAGFAALGRVTGRMRFEEARSKLARAARDTLFQPEAPDVPVQVLGILESAGIAFDHLWVTGMTDAAWPMPARAHPFIPVSLQRQAGIPESSAALSLALDRRMTEGWMGAAGEVVFSHPLREDDQDLAPSPLICGARPVSMRDLLVPEIPAYRRASRAGAPCERVPDSRAPRLAAGAEHAGGTALFRDQAACPFRAFASHRLRAATLESPQAGPDARDRGTLVHALLDAMWKELQSHAKLAALSQPEREEVARRAAGAALAGLRRRRPDVIEGRFATLEKDRLAKLGLDWLEAELKREPFEVALREHRHAVSFGGVTVQARLDRMDRITGMGDVRVLFDYKTGTVNVGDWLGPRPDEPQLPLYAVGQAEGVAALVFARVKAGEMRFRGIAREPGLVPGVEPLAKQRAVQAGRYASWDALLQGWRDELESLGREFVSGEARVDPKRPGRTCQYCGLQPLCRINERAAGLSDDDEDDGDSTQVEEGA